MLANIATTKNALLSLFMHAMAISKKLELVKIVTIPILVMCLMLTQHAPFTNLDDAPKIIMKNRNKLMNYCWPKASARSLAAACTRV